MDVLLHICCGVCAGGVVEQLREEGFHVIGYFYNPNIHPEAEYRKRLCVAVEVAEIIAFDLVSGEYDSNYWLELTQRHEGEPEGGERCGICFQVRLAAAFSKCQELGIPYFTTTLTVSPHKDSSVINAVGREIGKEQFLERDFKKKDGFKRAVDLAKEYSLYRQDYCGCIYSKKGSRKGKV